MNEKYILTTTMHLGYSKDTFRRGAVIEYMPERNVLVIDGRTFQDTRDIEVLKNRSRNRPDAPWIVPYSDEVLENIKGVSANPRAVQAPAKKNAGPLPVVQSDEDSHQVIDIRHTQVGKRNNEAKDAARTASRDRDRTGTMEIIKGDQSVEERIAELNDKTDMASVTERVNLKRKKASMPIVRDDSLGMGTGRSEIPMNAGQHLPSREEGEASRASAEASAAAYKSQVGHARKAAGVEVPEDVESATPADSSTGVETVDFEDSMETPQAAAREAAIEENGELVEGDEETLLDEAAGAVESENAELRAENAELKEGMSAVMERLAKLEEDNKPRPAGRPKGSRDSKPRGTPRKANKKPRPAAAAAE